VDVLIVLGGGGGICAVLTIIVIIGRGVFRQVNATEDNTSAVRDLTKKVEDLMNSYNGLERRLAVVEDRLNR
jgi:hypothetical protein